MSIAVRSCFRFASRLALAGATLLPSAARGQQLDAVELVASAPLTPIEPAQTVLLEATVTVTQPSSFAALEVAGPPWLRSLPASASAELVSGFDRRTLSFVADPDGSTVSLRPVSIAETETIVPLAEGTTLTIRWLAVAGSEPADGNLVSVRFVDALGGFEEVAIEVVAADEGLFSDGLILARVFCDENGDLIQQSDERGLPAARVVLDTGWVATSDLDGDLHFDRVRPGPHAIELDAASLPGRSTPIGSAGRIIDVGLGLGAAALFAVDCEFEQRDDADVWPIDLVEAAAIERYRATTFAFRVDASRESIEFGRTTLALPTASLLSAGERDVAVGPTDEISLDLVAELEGHWVVETTDALTGDVVDLVSGDGAAPSGLGWRAASTPDGSVPAAIYLVRGRVFTDTASVETAPLVVRVTGSAPGAAWSDTYRGEFFVESTPGPEFDALVESLWQEFDAHPDGRLIVDVHVDDDEVREDEVELTRAQALELQWGLIERGVPAERVVVGGRGADAPLVPNVGSRNRQVNRRVEAQIETALGRTSSPPEFELAATEALVRVNERQLADAAIGEPMRLDRPVDDVVIVEVVRADGSRSALRVALDEPARAALPAHATEPSEPASSPADEPAPPSGSAPPPEPAPTAPTTGPFAPVSLAPWLRVRPASAPSQAPPVDASSAGSNVVDDRPDRFSDVPREYDVLLAEPVDPGTLQQLLAQIEAAAAGQTSVYVPDDGETWDGLVVPIFGETPEGNRVFVNGSEIEVVDGRFAAAIDVDSSTDEIVVETRDEAGFRGVVRVPIAVDPSRVSVVALGDLAVGSANAVPSGRQRADALTDDGSAAVYLSARGYLEASFDTSGVLGGLFEQTDVIAHVDTERLENRDAIEQVAILPLRGELLVDGSTPRRDLTSDWPVALDVVSGDSTLRVGNARVEYVGVDAFRHERTLTGVRLDLDERWDDGTRLRLQAHAGSSDDDGVTRRALLRGTGGSVYFLEASPVREGSEHVEIVVVNALSGAEVFRRSLTRNDDYTLEPLTGRIVLASPLPSQIDDGATSHAIVGTRALGNGHRVYLAVGYETTESLRAGSAPWGLSLRQTVLDVATFGGGIVREQTNDGGRYSLATASLELGNTPTTQAAVEFATSESTAISSRFSPDGGLLWRDFSDPTREVEGNGNALHARASIELADLIDTQRERLVRAAGYMRQRDEGFSSWGDELVAREAWGARLELVPTEPSTLIVRHDSSLRDVEAVSDSSELLVGNVSQDLTAFEWFYNLDRASVSLGYEHSNYDDSRTLGVFNTDIVGGAIHYNVAGIVRVGVRQEVVARGDDPRLLRGTDLEFGETRVEDRFITALTAETELPGGVTLDVAERFRYSGENHASVGLRAKARDGADLYLRQTMTRYRDNHGTVPSFVIGSSEASDDGAGRSWGEYQIGDGVSPWRTQALLGHGRSFAPTPWLGFDLAYEHSEILAGPSSDSAGTRDAGHFGFRAGDADIALFSGFAEVRLESAGPIYPASEPCLGDDISLNSAYCTDRPELIGDRRTIATEPSLSLRITPSLTSLSRLFVSSTYNETLGVVERREVEGSTGLAYRPQQTSRVAVVTRFTHIDRARRLSTGSMVSSGHRENVMSLTPAFQLASRAWLTPRFAWRSMATDAPSGAINRNQASMLGLRLAWRVTDAWEAASEYRFLTETRTDGWSHGALLEGAWILDDVLRIGLGYNLARFTADELGDLDRDGSGFFVRLTGRY